MLYCFVFFCWLLFGVFRCDTEFCLNVLILIVRLLREMDFSFLYTVRIQPDLIMPFNQEMIRVRRVNPHISPFPQIIAGKLFYL